MNNIIITGRLTRDPELKACNSGTEVCNLSVAVDRRVKKGEEKQCDFFDCTGWGKTAAFINTYFHKGDGITIRGRMESRKWVDKDGNNRISWGVNCDDVEFPLSKGDHAGSVAAPAFTETTSEADLPF